jgi:lincosamide nucleotidyltransferase A/C/D/E
MLGRDVTELLECLERAGLPVWLDGGWGIDALLARRTRAHADLDLVIARVHLMRAEVALARLGFQHAPEASPGLPARLVLRDAAGRQVDLHPVVLDEHGNGYQDLGDGTWCLYPAEGLTGTGEIEGRVVRCITPDLQLRHHLGYPPQGHDRADMARLAQGFGLVLPPPYTTA